MRTPFQRDRDRIVHSKPFRRLKGKTQVFIDPEGDHYRTRMTHTLETTAISRVVARALRLNEDLVEAIGLGHDTGHTPFGHAGEQALDEALRDRFGTGRFRHNEQSLRIARAAEPHRRGLRRDPHAHRAAGACDARGQDRPDRRSDRVRQPRHRRCAALRPPFGGRPPAGRDRAARATRARAGSTRSSTTSSRRPRPPGDIVQGEEVGEAMLSLRSFMFERVYLGPQVTPEHRRAERVVRAIFDRLCDEPERLPPGDGSSRRADHGLPRRHDRPLRAHVRRALGRVGSRGGAHQGRLGRRGEGGRGHRRGRLRCGRRSDGLGPPTRGAARSTRSERRASPSTRSTSSTTASAAGRAATSSGSSRRARTSTSPGRSSGSPTGSASRSSTRSRRHARTRRDAVGSG